jgi:uncharacterized damage-inducible protein DinB
MSDKVSVEILSSLAAHNQWANQKIFKACSAIDPAKLEQDTHGYDSVIGILNHLVQVEHSFFELANGRQPQRIQHGELKKLRLLCADLDRSYLEYIRSLKPREIEAKRFLVPWFGFDITLLEGILQPLTHSHKHRADVSMLLPLLGGSGIEMDFIQWLDDLRGEE